MKKFIGTLLIALTITSFTHSRNADAGIGLLTGNVPLAVVGAGMAGTSGVVFGVGIGMESEGLVFTGFLGGLIGLIILDAEEGQMVGFSAINEEVALEMDLTREEVLAYNSELDQINFVLSEVAFELGEIEEPTAVDSRNLWEEYQSLLSVEAFHVVQLLSTVK